MNKMSDYKLGTSRELRENQQPKWTWAQPANTDELLQRLAHARDFAVPERERENLCVCAHTAIKKLQEAEMDRVKPLWEAQLQDAKHIIDEAETLLQEFVDDAAYAPNLHCPDYDNNTFAAFASSDGNKFCKQCGADKNRHKPVCHEDGCVVGKAEAFLRHREM